jgi:hypothetical protein
MKKIYMTPELEEIEIKSNQPLLLGSGVTSDDIGWGGIDDGTHEPSAPELPGTGLPGSITPEGLLGFPF